MSRSRFACSIAFATFIAASAPAFAGTLFTDGTFNLANYNQVGPFTSGGTITAAQCASCGNPGTALQVMETFGDTTVNEGTAALGFVNTTFSYNPSTQGAIVSIQASVDKDATLSGFTSTSLGNTFRPLIEQDGNYYLAAIAGAAVTAPGTTGFIGFSSGLVATDFLQYDFTTGTFGTASPNFAGDPMLFGLAQISTLLGIPAGATFEQDYDNLSFTLSAPEPASTWVLVSLLPLVGLALRRRRLHSN